MARVICDTSSLIKLSITDTLKHLPELFSAVLVPEAVYRECPQSLRTEISTLGFSVGTPSSRVFVQFGAGECEALNMALDDAATGSFVLTDDRKAINAAARVGIKTITAFDFFAALKLTGRIANTQSLMLSLGSAGEGINKAELRKMLERTGEHYEMGG